MDWLTEWIFDFLPRHVRLLLIVLLYVFLAVILSILYFQGRLTW